MDIATLGGLLLGVVCLVFGMKPQNLAMFIDPPSMFLTIGGSVAGTVISFSVAQTMNAVSVAKNAFFITSVKPGETIKLLVSFAEQARREGILSLESRAQEVEDEFLKKGVQLAVDGTEPELIKDIMNTEISFIEERHKSGADFFDQWGSLAPAFGMIGTLIGLILMLANMSDPQSIGPNMAVALITTLYGAIIANLFCIPINKKLKCYSSDELLVKELMLEGVMSLQSGDNPRIVEQKLTSFISPADRADVITKD